VFILEIQEEVHIACVCGVRTFWGTLWIQKKKQTKATRLWVCVDRSEKLEYNND